MSSGGVNVLVRGRTLVHSETVYVLVREKLGDLVKGGESRETGVGYVG